jgi:hypothetical protein
VTIKTLDDGRLEFTTVGMRFQQNPNAPEQFAFVASANELIRFCGVARKSHGLLSNYQRAMDTDRIRDEVTPFFKDPSNCSPTAIVVSLQPTNVCEIAFASDKEASPPIDEEIESTPIDNLTLRFHDLKRLEAAEIVSLAKAFLDARLVGDSDNGDDFTEVMDESDSLDEEQGLEQENDDDVDNDEPVEIGKSMLRDIRKNLDDPSELTETMIENLREMLMPALVIDGQHRLFGAAGVEEDLPMLVCCLVAPSWKEQVFQFVVVNDKASGIPKPFITSLAGMSLTSSELKELENRLTQAGLKLWEVEVMQRLGYDNRSPFHGKIEFKVSGGNESEGLGYQTMKRIGKSWHHPRSAGLYAVMEKLYRSPSDSKKLSQKALRGYWQTNEDWFDFLCLFWSEFEKKFSGTDVWQMHSNLMTAVVLEMLQSDFLLYLDSTKDLVWDFEEEDDEKCRDLVLNKFHKLAKTFADKHKEAIYSKNWKAKSLSHKAGKAALADFFQKIRDGKSLANHPIYSGQV